MISKLKCEIADLKVEKAYFQSRCHNLEDDISDLASTSKVFIIYILFYIKYKLSNLYVTQVMP